MANRFDISVFSDNFLKVGLAQRSYFYVKFTPPGGLANEYKDVAYLGAAASLPGKRLATTEQKPYGYGQTIKSPYDVLYDDIQVSFYVDAKRALAVDLFNEWIGLAVSETKDFPKTPMRVGYRSDYICNDFKIYVVSPFAGSGEVADSGTAGDGEGVALIECHLVDAFPIQVDAIDLDWGQTDFIRIAVTFAFRSADYMFGQFNPVISPAGTYNYETVKTRATRSAERNYELNPPTVATTTPNGLGVGGGIVQTLQQFQVYKTQWSNLLNARGAQQTTQALLPLLGNNRTATDTINNLSTLITNTNFVRRNASSIFKFP
jgi:hypothetical protein